MAFRWHEKDAQGRPTADAKLGALLEYDYQSAMVAWWKAWVASRKADAEEAEKAKHKARRRGRRR